MLSFDEPVLTERLSGLTAEQRSHFALSIAKRLVAAEFAGTTLPDLISKVEADPDTLDLDPIAALLYALDTVSSDDNLLDTVFAARRGFEYAYERAQNDLNLNLDAPGMEDMLLQHRAIQGELTDQETTLAGLEDQLPTETL